jgi:hypothetical protein
MLSVIMLSVITPRVITIGDVMIGVVVLSVIKPSVTILSDIMLNVIMLNVVAPFVEVILYLKSFFPKKMPPEDSFSTAFYNFYPSEGPCYKTFSLL